MIPLLLALSFLLAPTLAPVESAAVPAVGAHPVPPTHPASLVHPAFAAWSTDLGLSLGGKPAVAASPPPKSVCALGDADGDGYGDILVRYAPGQADGHYKFQALAGPGFTRVLWLAEPRDGRLVKCGADVTGDGTPDPIVVAPPAPAAPAPLVPVQSSSSQTTLTPIDGASGEPLATVAVDSGATQAGTSIPASSSAGSSSAGDLLPSGEGSFVLVESSRTGAVVDGPAGATAAATVDQATVRVVDADGSVRGTVALPPAADAVAVAALPSDGPADTGTSGAGAAEAGAAVVLTEREASPADGAPAGVPTLTVADAQGNVLWQAEQDATAGVPVVLPQAGDVDGDGHADLIYATVPADGADAAAIPSSAWQVLSGDDGSVLMGSGADAAGLVTALPFGNADGQAGDEVLAIVQSTPDAPVELSVQGPSGEPEWTATVPAGSEPANAVEDANGNTVGFSDLTGDGVPDVAVVLAGDGGTEIVVVDGATGGQAWTESYPAGGEVQQVPADGGGSDLAIVDAGGGTVTLVDGGSGRTEWQVKGDAPANPVVEVQPAGDLDGDGSGDVLVTFGSASNPESPEPASALHAVSGADGAPLWSASGRDGEPAPEPLVVVASASHADEAARGIGGAWWWLAALAVAAAVVIVVVAVRRRKSH